MKVTLVFVSTVDGKVTKWGQPHVKNWTSAEDKVHFKNVLNNASLIVMGRKSYEAEPLILTDEQLFVVMTRSAQKYRGDEVPGKLEFSDQSPLALRDRFENLGYRNMLVLGGPRVATSFLKENLVDELWLTIEPKIFGAGDNFAMTAHIDVDLKIISCNQVNEKGTLIARYRVLKPGK